MLLFQDSWGQESPRSGSGKVPDQQLRTKSTRRAVALLSSVLCSVWLLPCYVSAQSMTWPEALLAPVVYSPSAIGTGSYSEPRVMDVLYGWQNEDILERDFDVMRTIFKNGTTVIVPLGLRTSGGGSITLTTSLCSLARRSSVRLLPAVSFSQLVQSLGGVQVLLADKNLLEKTIVSVRTACSFVFASAGGGLSLSKFALVMSNVRLGQLRPSC